MTDAQTVATPAETREEFLKLSGRGYTVVRHVLRQLPKGATDRVSVLGPLVRDRKRRSLQIYLMLLLNWSWLSQREAPLPAESWARALRTATGRQWTTSNVSAAWTDLEDRGLITRRRLARGVIIAPRREDGQAEYTKPGLTKKDFTETYFVLPKEFWTQEWFERLTMPGLAMLLIIAGETSVKPEVWLTNSRTGLWYGLSPRSVETGIEDLRGHGLLEERVEWVKAPLSAIGSTKKHWYSLLGPFSTADRRTLQKAAQRDRATRLEATERAESPKKSGKKLKKAPKGSKKPAKRAKP